MSIGKESMHWTRSPRGKLRTALVLALATMALRAFATEVPSANDRFDPRTCAMPVKPAAAQAEHRSGAVMLAILIGADGTVQKTRIVQSSGHADLDEATRAGFARCTFKPGKVDGVPTAAWQMIKYIWSPEDSTEPAQP